MDHPPLELGKAADFRFTRAANGRQRPLDDRNPSVGRRCAAIRAPRDNGAAHGVDWSRLAHLGLKFDRQYRFAHRRLRPDVADLRQRFTPTQQTPRFRHTTRTRRTQSAHPQPATGTETRTATEARGSSGTGEAAARDGRLRLVEPDRRGRARADHQTRSRSASPLSAEAFSSAASRSGVIAVASSFSASHRAASRRLRLVADDALAGRVVLVDLDEQLVDEVLGLDLPDRLAAASRSSPRSWRR